MWCVYAYMHTKEYCCLVTKLCPTLWDPVEYSPSDPSVHEISQARIPEWVVISFSMRSSQLRYQTRISYIGREILYCWITREAPKGYSVQFSRSVVSDSLWPYESQHTRPPCPSPTPGVHSDTRPSSQWCRPAISSSVVPISSCSQSLPASESFPMSQLFAWGGQSTGLSALASFLPKKSQGWSPSEWSGWVSLQSKWLSRVFSLSHKKE